MLPQPSPLGGPRGGGGSDWPRNGAKLKGTVHEVRGAKWLEVKEQVPAGKEAWQPVASGCWMPFDGGAHNGGQWLHDPATWKGRGGDSDVCKRY